MYVSKLRDSYDRRTVGLLGIVGGLHVHRHRQAVSGLEDVDISGSADYRVPGVVERLAIAVELPWV